MFCNASLKRPIGKHNSLFDPLSSQGNTYIAGTFGFWHQNSSICLSLLKELAFPFNFYKQSYHKQIQGWKPLKPLVLSVLTLVEYCRNIVGILRNRNTYWLNSVQPFLLNSVYLSAPSMGAMLGSLRKNFLLSSPALQNPVYS